MIKKLIKKKTKKYARKERKNGEMRIRIEENRGRRKYRQERRRKRK